MNIFDLFKYDKKPNLLACIPIKHSPFKSVEIKSGCCCLNCGHCIIKVICSWERSSESRLREKLLVKRKGKRGQEVDVKRSQEVKRLSWELVRSRGHNRGWNKSRHWDRGRERYQEIEVEKRENGQGRDRG